MAGVMQGPVPVQPGTPGVTLNQVQNGNIPSNVLPSWAEGMTASRNALGLPTTVGSAASSGPDYASEFAKSLAQSRAAIAAQMGAALHEIQQNAAAGQNEVNAFGPNLQALYNNEVGSNNALAHSADAAMSAGGIKDIQSATHSTNPINAAGGMANVFAQGAVPLLHQGVSAQADAQRNALAIAQSQADQSLADQQRQFDAQQLAGQQGLQRQEALYDYEHGQSPYASSVSSNPLALEQGKSVQAGLDKLGITSFTADQLPAIRQTPQYQFIKSQAGTSQFQKAVQDMARMPGHAAILDALVADGIVPTQLWSYSKPGQ